MLIGEKCKFQNGCMMQWGGGDGGKSVIAIHRFHSVYLYNVYVNKTQDLMNIHILGFFIMYLNVASDDLHQKIVQKIVEITTFFSIHSKHGTM